MTADAADYVVGVDFGTLSGRALLVRVSDGAEVGTAVHDYRHGVMDSALAATREPLPPDWALQDPEDYRDVLREAVPAAVAAAGVDPARVIGIATDFTACTAAARHPRRHPAVRARRPGRAAARVGRSCGSTTRPRARRTGSTPLPRAAQRAVAGPVRRQDLGRVGVREGAAGARGGPGDVPAGRTLDRGGRLDHLAAVRRRDPQRLHRRVQGRSTRTVSTRRRSSWPR